MKYLLLWIMTVIYNIIRFLRGGDDEERHLT